MKINAMKKLRKNHIRPSATTKRNWCILGANIMEDRDITGPEGSSIIPHNESGISADFMHGMKEQTKGIWIVPQSLNSM
jgi:hypothetical protein